jgi:hypothetical protein
MLWSLLCIPWALVLWIQFSDPRGGTVLLTYQVINPLTYLYTQANGIMMYLSKVLIPRGIILDYGWPVVLTFAQCAPAFLALVAMVGATIFACVRFPRVGFLGAWFFIILGPTSSVVPIITEILAEHRMYLPMMPVITLLVAGTAWALARLRVPERVIGPAGLAACLGVAGFLGWRTHWQNQLYHDSVDMWEYNAKITPENRRVWYNICVKSRVNRKDLKRAEEAGQQALRISPDYPDAHMQMAIVMKETNRLREAEQYAMNAVRFEPDKGHHYALLGEILTMQGRHADARAVLTEGLKRDEQSQDCMMTTLRSQLLSDGVDVAARQASIWMRLPVSDSKILGKLLALAEEYPDTAAQAAEIRRRLGPSAPPPRTKAAAPTPNT